MKTRLKLTLLFSLFNFTVLAHAGMAPVAQAGKAASVAECTTDYKTASGYFQKVLGDDASLARIPAFVGEYAAGNLKLSAENTIKDGGGPVYLEVKLSLGKFPFGSPINIPVRVCRNGERLTANLIMSGAVFKGPKGETSAASLMKDIPPEVVIAVSRAQNQQVTFKSETFPNQPASSVTVR